MTIMIEILSFFILLVACVVGTVMLSNELHRWVTPKRAPIPVRRNRAEQRARRKGY